MTTLPLKLFVCEFITGGGLSAAALPESLAREGMMMRDALLHDLIALDRYEIITTHDVRIGASPLISHSIAINGESFDAVFRDTLVMVDLVWLIAPETDGILLKLSELCYDADVIFLGCGFDATRIGTSKLLCFEALTAANIKTLPVISGEDWLLDKDFSVAKALQVTTSSRWVAKPEDGAGCDGIQIFDNLLMLTTWLKADDRYLNYLVQPFQAGFSASFSMLCKNGKSWLLSCNQQHIICDHNTFTLQGITVNGMQHYWQRLETLARKIAKMLPDAAGYLGVDVLIDTTHDTIYVLEINPRLTTSYVILGEATGKNVAQLIIESVLSAAFKCPMLQKNKVQMMFE